MPDDLAGRLQQMAGGGSEPPTHAASTQADPSVGGNAPSNPALFGRLQKLAGAQAQQTQAPQHGSLYQAADRVLNDPTANGGGLLNTLEAAPEKLVNGALKGALGTASGLGSIYNKVTGSQQPFNQDNLHDLITPNGVAEHAGNLGEQAAEFATGEGALAKAGIKGIAGKAIAGGLVSGAQSGGDKASTFAGAGLGALMSEPAVKAAGKLASKVLGMRSGAGEQAIARAFLNPQSSGLAKAMRGDISIQDVVHNFESSITGFRDQAAQQYRAALEQINTTQIPNWHAKSGRTMQNLADSWEKELPKFGAKEYVSKQNPGKLYLNLRQFSGTADEKGQVEYLWKLVRGWGKTKADLTPAGLDSLKQQVGNYIGQEGRVGALATRMYKGLSDDLNTHIPGYGKMTADYRQAQDLLKDFKREMSVGPNQSVNNDGTISRKLQYLFKQGTNYRELLTKRLPGGEDLLDQVAGLHLHDVMPRGLMRALLGAEGIVSSLVNTTTGGSPRVVGETARALGKVSQTPMPNVARRVVQAANPAFVRAGQGPQE